MTFQEFCNKLETKIKNSYEEGITLEDAEKLAGEFLYGMIQVSNQLKTVDLDSRMRKSGLKSIKATVYTDAKSKPEIKLTEAAAEHLINSNPLVNENQIELDKAESERDSLERHYNIFREAHLYFRQLAKGSNA